MNVKAVWRVHSWVLLLVVQFGYACCQFMDRNRPSGRNSILYFFQDL